MGRGGRLSVPTPDDEVDKGDDEALLCCCCCCAGREAERPRPGIGLGAPTGDAEEADRDDESDGEADGEEDAKLRRVIARGAVPAVATGEAPLVARGDRRG